MQTIFVDAVIYQFNKTKLNSETFSLSTDGIKRAVEPQIFNLILYLVKNRNRIVTRNELLDQVWQGRVVSDTSINNNIKSARKALGDDGVKQKVIKTIHSRGYQFIAEVKKSNSFIENKTPEEPVPIRSIRIFLIYGLIAILLVSVFIVKNNSKSISHSDVIHSIAVLPFLNNSTMLDTDYYGFAVADEIIGALNYIESIHVRPASSIRAYATSDYDPIEVGKTLGVDYVLTGHYSINDKGTSADTIESFSIRLVSELIDIKTGQLIWRGEPILSIYSETFKIQNQVVRQMLSALNINSAGDKLASLQQNIPQSPLAYEYYLRSLSYSHDTTGHQLAIAMLKQSTALDDAFAPAFSQLGNRIHRLAQFGLVKIDDANTAEKYYLHALTLNPESLEAMAYLSMLYTETNRIDEAIELARNMHDLNSSNANTHFTLGYIYRYAGLLNEAIFEMEKAVSLDPKNIKYRSLIGTYSATQQYQKAYDLTYLYEPSPFTYGWQGLMSGQLGNTEKALKLYDKLITEYPNNLWANVAIIHKSAIVNDIEAGLKAIDALVNTDVTDGETIYYSAAYYCLLENEESCLEMLEEAVDYGYFNYHNIASNEYFDVVKNEPRFISVLNKAKNKHDRFREKYFPEQ